MQTGVNHIPGDNPGDPDMNIRQALMYLAAYISIRWATGYIFLLAFSPKGSNLWIESIDLGIIGFISLLPTIIVTAALLILNKRQLDKLFRVFLLISILFFILLQLFFAFTVDAWLLLGLYQSSYHEAIILFPVYLIIGTIWYFRQDRESSRQN